jgi:hypothetical protein
MVHRSQVEVVEVVRSRVLPLQLDRVWEILIRTAQVVVVEEEE